MFTMMLFQDSLIEPYKATTWLNLETTLSTPTRQFHPFQDHYIVTSPRILRQNIQIAISDIIVTDMTATLY